jgi:hypothetical protein
MAFLLHTAFMGKSRIMKHFADTDTPLPGDAWKNSSEEKRRQSVSNVIDKYDQYDDIEVQSAAVDGRVVLCTEKIIPANERGLYYLKIEEILKQKVDVGISVWCEPVGDKSKLRALRGVNF